MIVLLALGYLIAYHTPLRFGWRALLVAGVVPLALFTNVVRLTFILLAGAYHGAGLADMVHHNEAPVLIFFCSAGLMALRHALLTWTRPEGDGGPAGAATPAVVHP
jgi:exosortase/archaeosortase family protein